MNLQNTFNVSIYCQFFPFTKNDAKFHPITVILF